MHNRLLLDTCALLWLAGKSAALSTVTRLAIEEAEVVYVSPVTAWELALKFNAGKLRLPCEPIQWFEHALDVFGLEVLPLDYKLMMKSTQLPFHHRDPADRTIIESALENKLTVVTGDHRFEEYGVTTIC